MRQKLSAVAMRMMRSVRQPGDLRRPDRGGVVVLAEDGDQQVGWDAEVTGQQLPGVGDGGVLEVVAEGLKLPSISKKVWWRAV